MEQGSFDFKKIRSIRSIFRYPDFFDAADQDYVIQNKERCVRNMAEFGNCALLCVKSALTNALQGSPGFIPATNFNYNTFYKLFDWNLPFLVKFNPRYKEVHPIVFIKKDDKLFVERGKDKEICFTGPCKRVNQKFPHMLALPVRIIKRHVQGGGWQYAHFKGFLNVEKHIVRPVYVINWSGRLFTRTAMSKYKWITIESVTKNLENQTELTKLICENKLINKI